MRALPDKNARILIYCNNNFSNALSAFPAKAASASLNIATYIALYGYGYRNVFELGPLIDVNAARLEFQSWRNDERKGWRPRGHVECPGQRGKTLIGMVEGRDTETRERWIAKLAELGRSGT
jgi:hypothetical protein